MLLRMGVRLDSRLGRAVQKMAGSKTFMRVGPKVVPHVDRFLHKVSGGSSSPAADCSPRSS
jgi:hypothetical protein